MANRINRAIELLEADQAIYYDGPHTGHVLTYEQGRQDAKTWADYINVGMEHGAFDMAGAGRIHARPGRWRADQLGPSHAAIIVEAPVNGIDGPNVAFNAWQFRQILARGVHGILLCQAESADAVKEFVGPAASRITRPAPTRSATARAAAARSRRRRRSGALISRSISPAASPGRSIRRASFCSV